jgi:hypothetical protein
MTILATAALAAGLVVLPNPATSQASGTALRPVAALDGGFPNAEVSDAQVSADGRWMVFSSTATNLTDDEASGFSEIYVTDLESGDVTLLSKIPEGGGPSDGDSFQPAICGDGSVVAFTTEAELLDPGIDEDFNGELDVYAIFRDADGNGTLDEFDVAGGVRIVRMSVGFEGLEADFGAGNPAISDDCSTVAFVTTDPLADDDLNDFEDVYVRDLTVIPEEAVDFDEPERVTAGTDPTSVTLAGGDLPALSADGNLVSFISTRGGHVAGPDADKGGVFVHVRGEDGGTEHVSVRNSDGRASVGQPDGSTPPAMTPDGRCIAFKAGGLDLTSDVVNAQGLFVRDRQTGETTLVSKNSRGIQAVEAGNPAISPDCRYAGFDSGDSSLIALDNNNARDAYVYDLETGGAEILSRTADTTTAPADAKGRVARGTSSVRQLLASGEAVVNSSAPDIRGTDGGTGIIDPFIVPIGNVGFTSPNFADVPFGAFYDDGVSWLAYYGITTGTSPTTFSPGPTVNRNQMALFMWRMMGEPAGRSSCGFGDESSISSSARVATCWLLDNGITTNNPYNPTGTVNRGQMAAFLWRLAGEPAGPTSCSFDDQAAIPGFAQQGACWLKANGITTNNPYNPAGNVTRAQMAAFLYRLASTESAWSGSVEPPETVTFGRN